MEARAVMPMTPTTVQPLLELFMVPVGPTGQEDPPSGWPDGVTPPPAPVEGTTAAGSSGTTSFRSGTVLDPGALVGGYVTMLPFWAGVRVLSNTTTLVSVAEPAAHPGGPVTEDVTAGADDDAEFTVSQAVGSIQSITRVGDGALLAPDDPSGWPDGVVATGEADPPILSGDVVRIVYTPPFDGPVPSGTAFAIARPKDPVSGLSTGTAWAGAYRALFAAGASNGVPPVAALLDPAEAAMKGVIDVMMSVPFMAPLALQAGAAAFWGVVAASSAALFPGSLSAIPPAGLLSMSALMLTAGGSAAALPVTDPWTPASSQAAAALFAGALWTASQGGLVVFPGPAAFPFL